MSGIKNDQGKLEWSQVPLVEFEQTVRVLTEGAKKYGSDTNWQHVPEAQKRYFNACMRHICAWKSGEKIDSEFGCNHLAHAIANLLFLMWFDNKEKDLGNQHQDA